MVGSSIHRGMRGRAIRAGLLVVVMSLLLSVGTASAAPTALSAGAGSATVTGTTPTTMSFPLGRAGDLGYDTWLRYRTEDGTAHAGTDYTAAEGEVMVPAGSSTAGVRVGILGESTFSPDKQFALQLSGAVGVGPTPTFADRAAFPTGASVSARATIGDLNGDGRPDVIVPDDLGSIYVLLDTTPAGSSTPSFAAPQVFPVGGGPEAATPTDINGDGRPDLLIADDADEAFSVMINTTPPGASTVSFAPEQVFEGAGAGPRLPVLADVNGDGRPDLVLTNDQFFEHAVSVFFNTTPPGATTASFGPRQYFEFFAPNGLAVTDVNGDGRPDIIATSQAGADEVVVILNETPPGGSSLSLGAEADLPVGDAPNLVQTADLNGDGKPDLAVSNLEGNSVSVLLNETVPGASAPSFAPQQIFAVGSGPRSLRLVDLNGDGRQDMVTGSFNNHSLTVLVNTSATGSPRMSFSKETIEAEPLPLGLAVADFNGDGRPDLTYTRSTGKVSVSLNTTPRSTAAAPTLAAKHDAPAGGGPSAVAAPDFNGDGRPDVAVADRDGDDISVLLDATTPGASTPAFAGRQSFATGDAPSAVAAGDFNLDGRPDLALTDEGSETASILLDTTAPGATTPSLAAAQAVAVGASPSAVAAADLNGDGRPDLAVTDRDDDDVSVAAVDVNLDGKPDLVVADRDDDTATVLINTTVTGATVPSFAPGATFATGSLPSSIAAADLNGDGKPDLVVANKGSDSVSVLFNTTVPGAASSSFAPSQAFGAGAAPSSVAIADLDGDGIPDLLVADEGADTTSVLLNTTPPGASVPAFAIPKPFATGGGPAAVAAADLNGDGGPDALVADAGDDAVSALLDTQYTVSVAPVSVTGTIHYGIPRPELEPRSLDFGAQPLGTTTTKNVTLSNDGGSSLAIGGIATGSGAVSFGQGSDCPPSLPVGWSCSIAVRFTPGAAGPASTALTVTSNAPGSPAVVNLFGSGAAAPAPGGGSTGPGGPSGPRPAAARLRIRKASRRTDGARLRIAVRGTIARDARGKVAVRVRFRTKGHPKTSIKTVKIAGGEWAAQLVLPAGIEPGSPIQVVARFGGGPGFDPDHAEKRLVAR
jgi:trimeric autotransporter adhesin